jgi:hypothetical protein
MNIGKPQRIVRVEPLRIAPATTRPPAQPVAPKR